MPQTKQIIFLKDKSGVFKLRSDVRSFGYDEQKRQYYVYFEKGNRVFHYNPANVDVAVFSHQLEPPFRITRKTDGEVFFHVLGVRVYEGRAHKAYRVIYENGTLGNYSADYLSIEEHIDNRRSINVWEYLNEVAKYNVIPVDDDNTVSLADKYAKMEFVAKNSLLENYLNVDTYYENTGIQSAPLFPFGCNRSQYKAVRNALDNKLSVIQGPPGTGKTQTILNIMANLLLRGETMQIVSNNNAAVENVQEKLVSNGLGFICAQLGRASNKKSFVEGQNGKYPDLSSWKLEDVSGLRKEAIALSLELQNCYENQEKLAICSEKLEEYKRQKELFPKKVETKRRWSSKLLERYLFRCSREMERKQHLLWLTRMKLRLHRLPVTDDVMDVINSLLIEEKVVELEQQCSIIKEAVKDVEAKNDRLRDLSMRILKGHLQNSFGKDKERRVFATDEIYLKTKDFLKEYPVVLSTTFSATSNINPAYKFDYLIMDEASQVDIAAGALALSCANNAVIVGDLKQLPNVVDVRTEEIVTSIFAKYNISEAYRYATNSFLSSICALYPKIPQTLLKEHYRCHPLIIGFCSKQFYNGELIPMKKDDSMDYAPIRVVRTVKGNHARGTVNYRQVESVVQEIVPKLEEHFTDIGIIAPYNNQVTALNSALYDSGRNYVTATVHKFQGRENDAIILSTVDNQVREFTDDPHLLNVAVSRAKKQFTLVVSADEQPDSNIQNLIDYIEYYQGSEQSQISSIFDLLYQGYTQELLNFYKNHRRVSEYDSENLAYWTIYDVIKEKGNGHLSILMHYPLRYLISRTSDLTEEQKVFAGHSWTHVDFLVYDTVSHKAKLAVEVDGAQYHKAASEQGQRDVKKDAVLAAIGLPLLRLSTTGSREKERIFQALTGT